MIQQSSISIDLDSFQKIVSAATAAQQIASQKEKSQDEIQKELTEVFRPFIETEGCRFFVSHQHGVENEQFLSALVSVALGKEGEDKATVAARNLLTKINEPEVKAFLKRLENNGQELVEKAAAKALRSLPKQAIWQSVTVCFAPGGALTGAEGYVKDTGERIVGINPLYVYRESDATLIDLVCHELHHSGMNQLAVRFGPHRIGFLSATLLMEGTATYAMLPFGDEHWFSQRYAKGAENADCLISRFGEFLIEITTLPAEEWEHKFLSEWTTRPKGKLPPMFIVGCKILEKIEEAFGRQKVIDGLSTGSVAILRYYNQAASQQGGYRFPDSLLDELEREEEALKNPIREVNAQ